MKVKYMVMILSTSLSPFCQAQDMQMMLTSELRSGYSTNTYLNPFFSEWDRTYNSAFGLASIFGQLSLDKKSQNFELNGGYVYEPFFDVHPAWKGYLAYAKYMRQINSKFNTGINFGTSSFQSNFTRNLHWIQPHITWFPSAFTSLKFRTGSNFREYIGFQDSLDSNNRIDSYALEIESWPSFRWQVKGGIYGSFKNLTSIQDGLSVAFSASYLFTSGSKITSEVQFINYGSETTTTTESGNGPGGSPFNPPTSTTETQIINDQIFKLKFEGTYPVKRNISLFIASEQSFFQSSSIENIIVDQQVSAGIRLNMNPTFSLSGKKSIEPEWNTHVNGQVINLRYSGGGNLFLIGDFNDWEKPGISLIKISKNKYKANLKLQPGLYEYRILLINGTNEEWLEFSNNIYTITDSFNGTNAVLTVEE